METNDKPFRQPPAGKALNGEPEKKLDRLIKRRINIFLIDYFGYLNLLLAFIVFAAGLFFFIYPRYQKTIKGDETVKKNLQADYEEGRGYLEAVRELKKAYNSISVEDRKKIEAMAPAGYNNVELITDIESIALRNGVILNSIKIEEGLKSQARARIKVEPGEKTEAAAGIFEQLPAGASSVKMEIDLSSVSYPALKNLLKTFENNLRLFDIARVDYDAEKSRVIFTVYAYNKN